jgi:hypothetical protein
LHAQFGKAIGEGGIAVGRGGMGGLDRGATSGEFGGFGSGIPSVVVDDDFLDLVETVGELADVAEDGLVLVELRASSATQDRVLLMLWDDGDSNLKGSQVFDIGKIGTAVLDKTFGLLDGGRGFGQEVVKRLVLDDGADLCLLFQVLNVRVWLDRGRGGVGVGNGHVGGRVRVGRAHD